MTSCSTFHKFIFLLLTVFITICPNLISGTSAVLQTTLLLKEKENDERYQFYQFSDVAVDSSGNIYISDAQDNCIKKFGPDGKYLLTIDRKGGIIKKSKIDKN